MTEPAPIPGDLLRAELERQGMTQTALAHAVGRPVQVLNDVVRGKKGITAHTALDLEKALGVDAKFWMHAQADHELEQARARVAAGKPRPGIRPNA